MKPCPIKRGSVVRDADSMTVYQIFKVEEVERAFRSGPLSQLPYDSESTLSLLDVGCLMSGWCMFGGRVGESFGDEPVVKLFGRRMLVTQFRSRDV